MGLLGDTTTEEYVEALKPPAPPEPFKKGTKVQVEITGSSPKNVGKSGYEYANLFLKLTREDGVSRKARQVFSFSPKAKQMNLRFLAGFGLSNDDLNSMPEGDLSPLTGLLGNGVCDDPEMWTGNDGTTQWSTVLKYMELPN